MRGEAAPSWPRIGYRRGLRSLVVSVWSVERAERRHPRHSTRTSPQVSALRVRQDRTPKAGVAGSNPARRTGCFGRSAWMTAPLGRGAQGRHRGSWSACGQRVVSRGGRHDATHGRTWPDAGGHGRMAGSGSVPAVGRRCRASARRPLATSWRCAAPSEPIGRLRVVGCSS